MDFLEGAQHFLGQALQSQITQFGLAFGFAALVHSKQVRKEIRDQMASITDAFNNLAMALRQDLANQAKRIGSMEEGMDILKNKVKDLENK